MHSILPNFPRVATIAFMSAALASIWPQTIGAEDLPPAAPRITATDFHPVNGVQLRIEGPNGDYQLMESDDLISWRILSRFGLPDGLTVQTDDFSPYAPGRFYRLTVWLAADGFHIQGDFAETILTLLKQANPNVWAALGIDFDASEMLLPAVEGLSGADRNARVLAAAVGSLSVLVQTLGYTHFPNTHFVDLVDALIADLSSGRLDGTDSFGQPVTIGEDPLPALSVTDLVNGLTGLRVDLPGLANVEFQGSAEGVLTISVPAQWNAFHWNSADWQ